MTNQNIENLNLQFTSKKADNDSILNCRKTWTKEEVLNYVSDIDCAELLLNYLTDDACTAEAMCIEFWFD
jgi:hypothetical protein